jgi:hypothetical protein
MEPCSTILLSRGFPCVAAPVSSPSSAITFIFASFPFITLLLLASNNGYLSSAVVSVIQAYACTLEVVFFCFSLRNFIVTLNCPPSSFSALVVLSFSFLKLQGNF